MQQDVIDQVELGRAKADIEEKGWILDVLNSGKGCGLYKTRLM